jgi:hypothetical protein
MDVPSTPLALLPSALITELYTSFADYYLSLTTPASDRMTTTAGSKRSVSYKQKRYKQYDLYNPFLVLLNLRLENYGNQITVLYFYLSLYSLSQFLKDQL